MRRRSFLLAVAAGPLARANQEATPVFRMDVSLISVDARVSAPGGRDIPDLDAGDFVVYDEGERQNISHFGRFNTPVDVLLVLDAGPAMRSTLIELGPRVREALSPLRSGDRAGLVLFGESASVVQTLTGDLMRIPRCVVDTVYKDRWGRASLVGPALTSAAHYLAGEPATGRRTIVLVTNTYASAGAASDTQVLRALYAADAVTNVILVGSDAPQAVPAGFRTPGDRRPDLTDFARRTGGSIVSGDDAAASLRRVLQDATTRYSLQYPSPGGQSGSTRSIRVELSSAARARYPGARIQARSGYLVP